MNFNARGADKRERAPNRSIHPCFIRSDAQIADELFQRTGERISPQYIGRLARKATEKIRRALLEKAG